MVLALVLLPALAGLLDGSAGGVAGELAERRRRRLGAGAHPRQGRRLRRAHAGGRPAGHPLDPALRRPHRLARAVPAGGAGDRARRRLRRGARCSASPSRSAPSSPAWCSSESELSQRAAEESLPLRDAFAVLFFVSVGMLFDPADPGARAAGRCSRRWRSSWSASRSPPSLIVRRLPPSARHGADDLREPGADRRVLLHPGRSRRRPRAAAGTGPRPDPRRRHPVDPGQSGVLRRLADSVRRGSRERRRRAPDGAPRPSSRAIATFRSRRSDRPCRPRRLWPGRQPRRRGAADARACRCWSSRTTSDIVDAAARRRRRGDRRQRRRAGVARGGQSGRGALAASSPSPTPSRPGRSSSRRARPTRNLPIIARAHSDAEVEHLQTLGANVTIMGEREIARAMVEHAV